MATDMTNGSPLRLLVAFSWPLLVGNVIQMAYALADMVIVGRLLGREALAAVGLAGCGGQRVAEFSGGMRRRVAILRALLARWDVLFLDEPFKGLDAETKALVMADTRRRCEGRTVLLVTHDPSEAEALGAVQVIHLPQ